MKMTLHPIPVRPRPRSDSALAVLGSIFLSLGMLPLLYAILSLQG
jgi:hypothetical protein